MSDLSNTLKSIYKKIEEDIKIGYNKTVFPLLNFNDIFGIIYFGALLIFFIYLFFVAMMAFFAVNVELLKPNLPLDAKETDENIRALLAPTMAICLTLVILFLTTISSIFSDAKNRENNRLIHSKLDSILKKIEQLEKGK